ncbi:MAG TPA: hypothetical protein VJB94_00455 [Candidatus Nanoarchaeia archaeon]|nr:hypothetical protein [Candidatus Nanoarchaeia archaeon]
MTNYELSDYLAKTLNKLAKRDKVLFEAIMKKIEIDKLKKGYTNL